jgi:membrane protease YdiL (CAAX protease family)
MIKLTVFILLWRFYYLKQLFKGILGFLLLDLYFAFIPSLFNDPFLQFGAILLFFPLALLIAKWVGLPGLKGMGFLFHHGWKKNFFTSFLVGFGFWMLMFGIQLLSGDLVFIGLKKPSELFMPILMIMIGFFTGSLINDLIMRGYVINLLKNKLHIAWVFTISILLYALDDYWYAGFSLNNMIFSMILGLSLTYAFYKTGSIWANTGIHYGLNVAYGLFFGMVGSPESSIIIVKENINETMLSEVLYFLIPTIMFLVVLWAMKFYYQTTFSINSYGHKNIES